MSRHKGEVSQRRVKMDVALNFLTSLLNSMTLAMVGKVFSLLLIATMMIVFVKSHQDKANPIDLKDLVIDQSGKIGGSQMRLNIAFLIASWILIFQTLNGALSEWLFAGYLAAFVYDRVSSRKSGGPLPAGVPAPITTASAAESTDDGSQSEEK